MRKDNKAWRNSVKITRMGFLVALSRTQFGMGNKMEKQKKVPVLIMAVVGIFMAITVFVILFHYYNNRFFKSYEVEKEIKRSDSNTVSYLPYNGNLLKYSKDGASAIDMDGTILWNGGYQMESPAVDICGEYVVVYNIGGKELYVYNGEDSGTKVETSLPIVKANIADQGVVAVLLEDTESNTIHLYNPYSSTTPLLVEIPTNIAGNGYPVDFDLSNDGNSLVTAYLNVINGSVSNQVSFYNFTEVGQDKNRLVGAKTFGETMVTKVQFTGDDEVAIFTQNGFCIFQDMKQPEEKVSKTFEQEISSVLVDEGSVGVILDQKKEKSKELKLYENSGREVLSYPVRYDYEKVELYGDEIIFSTARKCVVLRCNGREKFNSALNYSYSYIYPAEGRNRYVFIDDNNVQVIKLTGG